MSAVSRCRCLGGVLTHPGYHKYRRQHRPPTLGHTLITFAVDVLGITLIEANVRKESGTLPG